MPTIPAEHVEDALKLEGADGQVSLFEVNPLAGGTIYIKADDDVEWRGNLYEGLPMQLTGVEYDVDKTPQPKLTIGQENLDLLPFKGMLHSGVLEGGTVRRHILLRENLDANLNVKQTFSYRIKRLAEYSRTKISIVLAPWSSAQEQTIPFRQYIPPAFPWVDL